MVDQNSRSSKARCCQAAGCQVDLKGLGKAYNLKKRLCPKHMRAEAITKQGSEGQWRFCQQCGRLEPLHQFEGTKRSCMTGLQRRRDTHHANAATGKTKQQQKQQSCQAGKHLSGLTCQAGKNLSGPSQASSHQASEHLSSQHGQAGKNLSGPGLKATWNPSLAAATAAAAPHGVGYSNGENSDSMLPLTTAPGVTQGIALSSPATSVTAAQPAAAAAASVHLAAEVPYTAPLQGMDAAAAAVSHASDVRSHMQAQKQQPVRLPLGWQPAAGAGAAAASITIPAAPAAWTAVAAAPGNSVGCTGFDAIDLAALDEIEQQLLLAIETTQEQPQQQHPCVSLLTPPAAAGMPGQNQLSRELSRAATLARLQELSRQFAALQQSLQDGLAADLVALQCGQTAPQQQVQQQPAYGGGMGSMCMQSCGHVWQL